MAAPTPTAYQIPPGYPMKDGYRSLVTFAADPDVLLWIVGATPPGFDNGEPIRTSNMLTGTWHIDRPRSLDSLTPINFRANYHPLSLPQIFALKGVENAITFHWPTGNYTCFFGYFRSWQPNEHVEGADPEGAGVIQPTNWDPINNVQAAPVTGTS